MKILMIGGTGTISYDATKYFLAQNHDVYLLNRGNRNNLSDERLNYIIGNANDAKSLESALDGKEFDVILDFILYNVNQMKERLAIYNNKCKQFIFISSATNCPQVYERATNPQTTVYYIASTKPTLLS